MKMINLKTRKRFNRIISGVLSAAMVMTMVPDIWLPVYADLVRKDILNADIGIADDGEIISESIDTEEYDNRWSELAVLDPYSEEYAALKEALTYGTGTGRQNTRALRSASLNGYLLSNEYIAINAAPGGRFTIGTTGGDPNKTSDD